MTLGKYINKDSVIHRLDPRNKFIILILAMVAVFLAKSYVTYGILFIITFILFALAKMKFNMIFKSLKAVWLMMLFLLFFNVFVYKEGNVILDLNFIKIYDKALIQTIKIICRLILLISYSTLFTSTTKPLDITLAIDDLFCWLKIFKIRVSIFSMIISIALRFIPIILDDTYRIMNAQASRGVDFKNGKFKEKIVAISSLIVPLIICSFARSDELANAMEAKNYDPYAERSHYRKLKWHLNDTITLALSILLVVGYVLINIYCPGTLFDKAILNLVGITL